MSSMFIHETLAWVVDGFPLECDCVYLQTLVCGSIDVLHIDVPGFLEGSHESQHAFALLIVCCDWYIA